MPSSTPKPHLLIYVVYGQDFAKFGEVVVKVVKEEDRLGRQDDSGHRCRLRGHAGRAVAILDGVIRGRSVDMLLLVPAAINSLRGRQFYHRIAKRILAFF